MKRQIYHPIWHLRFKNYLCAYLAPDVTLSHPTYKIHLPTKGKERLNYLRTHLAGKLTVKKLLPFLTRRPFTNSNRDTSKGISAKLGDHASQAQVAIVTCTQTGLMIFNLANIQANLIINNHDLVRGNVK